MNKANKRLNTGSTSEGRSVKRQKIKDSKSKNQELEKLLGDSQERAKHYRDTQSASNKRIKDLAKLIEAQQDLSNIKEAILLRQNQNLKLRIKELEEEMKINRKNETESEVDSDSDSISTNTSVSSVEYAINTNQNRQG